MSLYAPVNECDFLLFCRSFMYMFYIAGEKKKKVLTDVFAKL